jgi:fermentation-respiration switch protein FrsA (DUF1100 family)
MTVRKGLGVAALVGAALYATFLGVLYFSQSSILYPGMQNRVDPVAPREGGGATCLLSRDRPLRALILQSTFPSLDIFAAGYGAPSFLLRDHFRSIEAVARFPGPVLVIHGRDDRLIPWEQGRRLAEASPHSAFRLYDCGHGCWDPEHLPFWHDAEPFLRDARILAAAPAGA